MEAGSGRGKRRESKDSMVGEEEINKKSSLSQGGHACICSFDNITDILNLLCERYKAGTSVHTIECTDRKIHK